MADDWGTDTEDTGAHPDRGPHTYCFTTSVNTDVRSSINNTAANALDGPTDAVVEFEAPCDTTSSTSQTDVVWQQSSAIPPDRYGTNICDEKNPASGRCDQFINTLYPNKYAAAPYPNRMQNKVACQEFGHSVGLKHGIETGSAHCMTNGMLYSTDIDHVRYSSHHVTHINGWFR